MWQINHKTICAIPLSQQQTPEVCQMFTLIPIFGPTCMYTHPGGSDPWEKWSEADLPLHLPQVILPGTPIIRLSLAPAKKLRPEEWATWHKQWCSQDNDKKERDEEAYKNSIRDTNTEVMLFTQEEILRWKRNRQEGKKDLQIHGILGRGRGLRCSSHQSVIF